MSSVSSARSQSAFLYSSTAEKPSRNFSLSTAFQGLSLDHGGATQPGDSMFDSLQREPQCPRTPSRILKRAPMQLRQAPSVFSFKTPTKYKIANSSPNKVVYLTRNSNTPAPAWDTKGRLEDMELLYSQLKSQMEGATTEKSGLEETLTLYKTRCKSQKTPPMKTWEKSACSLCE